MKDVLFDPPYVEATGLTRTPFADGDGRTYYEEPSREQQLKVLGHFVQYTNLVLFVEGPAGAGKTRLLTRFVAGLAEETRLCRVEGREDLSRAPLLAVMAGAFRMPERGLEGTALEEALREHLDGLRQSGLNAVVVIDDAHRLPAETVELIADLASKGERGEPLLHAVLFGESLTEAHVAAARRQVPDREAFKTIDLPPFGLQQTQEYLYYHLREAGAARPEALLPSAETKRIHRESAGLPGIINTLAIEYLQERAAKTAPQNRPHEPRRRRTAGTGVLVVGAIGAIAVWLAVGTGTEEARIEGPRGEQSVQPLALPGQEGTRPVPVSGAIERAAAAEEPMPGLERVAAIAGEELLPEKAMQTQPATEKSKAAPPKAGPPKATTRKPRNGLRGEDWLNGQNPNHFTLQLVASSREAAIVDFARRHGVTANSAYFRGLRNGRDWYSLVYGTYPDHASAEAAAKTLPVSVKSRPWIRTFGSIQADMRRSP